MVTCKRTEITKDIYTHTKDSYTMTNMVPFIDQFPEGQFASATVEYEMNKDGRNGYFLRAMRNIERGERIYRPYQNDYSNSDLILKFGKFEYANPHRSPVMIQTKPMNKNDPLLQEKYDVLGMGDQETGHSIFISERIDSAYFRDALSILRVQKFDDVDKVDQLLSNQILWDKPRENNLPPFDSRNELRVIMELTSLIEHRLTEYPRTKEGDVLLYEKVQYTNLNQNQQFGVLITAEEKMTMHNVLDALVKITDFLTMK